MRVLRSRRIYVAEKSLLPALDCRCAPFSFHFTLLSSERNS
jgi:hypothetical protein